MTAHRTIDDHPYRGAIRRAREVRRRLLDNQPEIGGELPRSAKDARFIYLGDLHGACAVAALMLAVSLGTIDVLRSTGEHAWIEVEGLIVDPTATQFDTDKDTWPAVFTWWADTPSPLRYHRRPKKGQPALYSMAGFYTDTHLWRPHWDRVVLRHRTLLESWGLRYERRAA